MSRQRGSRPPARVGLADNWLGPAQLQVFRFCCGDGWYANRPNPERAWQAGPVVRVHVVVSGLVQGVWYRQSCQERASARGVAGWVRNLDDGTVEAVLEGEQPAVETVLAWMADGPPGAMVSGLRVADEAPTGETGFSVR